MLSKSISYHLLRAIKCIHQVLRITTQRPLMCSALLQVSCSVLLNIENKHGRQMPQITFCRQLLHFNCLAWPGLAVGLTEPLHPPWRATEHEICHGGFYPLPGAEAICWHICSSSLQVYIRLFSPPPLFAADMMKTS